MSTVASTLLTILGISLLIVLHELGHYLAARLSGMRVERFSIGFGPALASRKLGETIWQLAAIPLGGFVQIQGMGPREDGTADDDPRSFRNQPVLKRSLVIFAGPATNWLLAAGFVFALASTVGFTRYDEASPVVGEILAGGPAAKAGLRQGDRILQVDDQLVTDWKSLVAAIRAHPEETVAVRLSRDGAEMQLQVTPKRSDAGGHGMIDVLPHAHTERYGVARGALAGLEGAWIMTTQQLGLLWGLVVGQGEGRLSGLPGIVKMVSKQAQRGLNRLLESLAMLSISLCLLNLLPVPALDGSRLLFLGVEAVRRRPINERIEAMVHAVGFVLLLALIVFVSIRDVL